MESGQPSESAVFSLPVRTRSEELEQLQLLEGSKNLKKIGIREKHIMPIGGVGLQAAAGSVTPTRPSAADHIPRSHANAIIADKNLTNVLLQVLVTEITSMRSTLESLAQNGALLAEIQRNNKLLALSLTSGHSLESLRDLDQSQIVKRVTEKVMEAEVVLTTI
ncbi:unnamed protein product [Calypogeia fissa]